MNHEKENKIIYYSVNLHFFFLSFFLSSVLSFFFVFISDINKKFIATLNSTHYKEFTTVFISLYLRMRRNSYTWSSIKQDVHTFLFYFLYLSYSHYSHTPCHPSFGLSISSLTLLHRAQPFLSGRCPFFKLLHIGKLISFYPASSLFGTQRQLTYLLVKSSTLPLRKILVFQGIAPWHTNCTLSCIIPLWDLATTHSPSGKEVMLSSQEDVCLSGRCALAHKFNIIRIIPLFLTQQQLTLPPVKSSSFPLLKNHVSQDLLFCNVLTYPAWAHFGLVLIHITY